MKLPSFVKTPRNRQFQIEPRYYDPVKEEIQARTERIRRELNGDQQNAGQSYRPINISFERRAQKAPNASLMQMGIAAILGIGIVSWLYLGNDILYALWLAVPVYLYFRFKKSSRANQ